MRSPPGEPPPLDHAPSEPAADNRAYAILLLIVLVDLLGFGLIIPLLPFYALKFDASPIAIGGLFAVYSLCQLVAGPVLGLLSDRFGRRPVLIGSQLGSVSGYVLLGIATVAHFERPVYGLMLLFLSRAVDGFSGGNISTAQAYIADVTPSAERSKRLGMLGAAFGLAFALGPAMGGLLGGAPGRESLPAFAAAAMSAIAAVLTFAILPESRWHEPSDVSWLHPSRWQAVLSNRPVMALMGVWLLSMSAFVMLETVAALYLEDRFGYGPKQVGLFFAFVGVVIIVVQGGLIGRLNPIFGDRRLMIFGGAVVTLAMAVYILAGAWVSLAALLVAGFMNAAGRSLQGPTLQALISRNTDTERQAVTFGIFTAVGSLARVVGPIVAGWAFSRSWSWPYAISAGLLAASVVWAMLAARGDGPQLESVASIPLDPTAPA